MTQYIVDAFTNKPFSGNPAAVCVMESWPSEESMMKLAMENNLSETAFIVREDAGYHLRWFTPGTEVELCGHATLASSFVILNYYETESDTVRFNTLSGVLSNLMNPLASSAVQALAPSPYSPSLLCTRSSGVSQPTVWKL